MNVRETYTTAISVPTAPMNRDRIHASATVDTLETDLNVIVKFQGPVLSSDERVSV